MKPLGLFEGYGVELEYMLVDAGSLAVAPRADALLAAAAGEPTDELERGDMGWSNELALHVIEFKTSGPSPTLAGVAARFQRELKYADALLEPLGLRLLGTGMHPLMDPAVELRLWPHEGDRIYGAFDRIFDCRGHGWANLQSMHVNLPFADDEQFARLHAAVRVLLPLLPALSASSPFQDGAFAGVLDARLRAYRGNARRVPSVSGLVVPEPARTRAEYERVILEPIYRDLAPLDPEGVLRHEWVNARGAIARFSRMALELRVLDTQEHPGADLAIAAAVTAVLRALVAGDLGVLDLADACPTEVLAAQLDACVGDAERAPVVSAQLREILGLGATASTAGLAWRALLERAGFFGFDSAEWHEPLGVILERGPLARRLLGAAGETPSRARLAAVYRDVADCLRHGHGFVGP